MHLLLFMVLPIPIPQFLRMMNIPALIGVEMNLEDMQTGTEAVVDGFTGEFILCPEEEK